MRRWLWRLRGLFFLAPAAVRLASVCLFVYVVQLSAARVEFVYGYSYGQALVPCFGLNWFLLSRGFYWQLLTYMFLHASWLHLGFNMLTVLLFGSGLEVEVGSRRFWRIFITGGVVGGIGWLAVMALQPILLPVEAPAQWLPQALRAWLPARSGAETLDTAMCIGASGGVFGLIGAYAAVFPRRTVYMLLPFPVRMKARTLALVLVGLDVAAAVFLQWQVAYAAHLAGGLSGYLYGVRLRRLGLFGPEE